MTTPEDRWKAMLDARFFLKEVSSEPEAPRDVRTTAIQLLKRYPMTIDFYRPKLERIDGEWEKTTRRTP